MGKVISGIGGGGKKIFVMEGTASTPKRFSLEGESKEGLVSPLHAPQYDLNADNIIDTGTMSPPVDSNNLVPPEEVGPESKLPPADLRSEEKKLGPVPPPGADDDRIEEAKNEGEIDASVPEARRPEAPQASAKPDNFQGPPMGEVEEKGLPLAQEEHEAKPEQGKAEIEAETGAQMKPNGHEEGRAEPASDSLGYLVQICAGKQHILHLTEEGHVYSYGSGIYGVCGQGGAACCFQHQILKSLSQRKVIQIACGEYHSLALTQAWDIYAWGRGFEGQLGITTNDKKRVEIASKPTFLPFFDKNKVKYIAAGGYYSLAVSETGELFGWGEARLGQLGCGKQSIVYVPQKICVKDPPEDVMRKTHSSVSLKDSTPASANPNGSGQDWRIKKVAAGFGHTAAVTEDGQLFMWGLNVFGQLGIGEKRNIHWKPMKVEKDITNNWLPKVRDVSCGYNFTFMIDCISLLLRANLA